MDWVEALPEDRLKAVKRPPERRGRGWCNVETREETEQRVRRSCHISQANESTAKASVGANDMATGEERVAGALSSPLFTRRFSLVLGQRIIMPRWRGNSLDQTCRLYHGLGVGRGRPGTVIGRAVLRCE